MDMDMDIILLDYFSLNPPLLPISNLLDISIQHFRGGSCFKVSVENILEAFAQGLVIENVRLTKFPYRHTATQDLRLSGSRAYYAI
jgi:hypothetical protein